MEDNQVAYKTIHDKLFIYIVHISYIIIYISYYSHEYISEKNYCTVLNIRCMLFAYDIYIYIYIYIYINIYVIYNMK